MNKDLLPNSSEKDLDTTLTACERGSQAIGEEWSVTQHAVLFNEARFWSLSGKRFSRESIFSFKSFGIILKVLE